MKINNVRQDYLFISLSYTSSFIIKLQSFGQVWLFNCFEGCQHMLARRKIKINQITKIIITDTDIKNISGLLGLLASISLGSQANRIDLYGPKGLDYYVFLGRKYSQTNFRYKLYIHTISVGLIIRKEDINLYSFIQNNKYIYCLLIRERPGRFCVENALKYSIPFGALYGKLKIGKKFLLPDGFIIHGQSFVNTYHLGLKIIFIFNNGSRQQIEVSKNATYLLGLSIIK